ncbi:MAG: hypothetical protein KGM43_15655, partial [Planctomycetota bacterium]|nr:hypothetical protein [Planctomycetota bacterium]
RRLRPASAASLTLACVVVAATACASARAQQDPMVDRAVAFLRSQSRSYASLGESAMIGLALVKADVPETDPQIADIVARIRERFSGGYVPAVPHTDVYEAAAVTLLLANLEKTSHLNEVQALANYIQSRQKANGSWDYPERDAGDCSISQYAILGLWEAENAGAKVNPSVWDRAAKFYLSVQSGEGSWNYHRDEPANTETISMTAAGTGSLLICLKQLRKHRKGADGVHPMLTPLSEQGQAIYYDPTTSSRSLTAAAARGVAWIGANFSESNPSNFGPSMFYGLYGLERLGALADKGQLGRVDWYEAGKRILASKQRNDGAWTASYGDAMNTVWGTLFLVKSTQKSLRKIELRRLGAGTLLGGRGLPSDLSTLTVAGGRVVSRPMNGAVEGMLAVLEDPRAENAEGALAGLVTKYRREGAPALKPYKDRFLKMSQNRDPNLRRVAVWCLARLGDLDVAPTLIAAIRDPAEDVVGESRRGLELLARRIDGYGPTSPSTPATRDAAADAWRRWYETIRPLERRDDDDDRPPVGAAPSATGGTP